MARIPAEEVSGEPAEMQEEESTTVIPASMTGGQKFKVGDVIQLEVTDIDEDGSLTVKYHEAKMDDEGPMEAMDRHFEEKRGAGSEPTY